MGPMADAFQPFDIVRVEEQRPRRAIDRAAAEVPLEVRLHGQSFSVIMRTPGDDQALAVGFLFSEGIVTRASEIQCIETNDRLNSVNIVLTGNRDRKSTRLNSSHIQKSRMPSSA